MSSNVFGSILNTQNLISLRVRDLNCEFILNRHDNLHGIERIKTEVIGEFGLRCYLGGVNFVKVLDNVYDTVGNLCWVNEGLSSCVFILTLD